MKQDLIYTHTYKQTLHMTTGLKSHLEILSKDRQTLSDFLYNVSQNNPFLEYTPSQDIQQYLEAGISNKPSLKDELYLQLHTSTKKYNEPIAHYIIESLDSHGFFDQDIQTVLSDLKCTKTQFEETLSFIQTFEPIGVAAKNSIDSLMIQLKEKGYTIAYTILKNYSKELEEKDFYTISESLDIPYESVFDELAHMQECNPFPCSEYDTESTTNLALPEFTIEIDEDQLKIIPKEMGNLSLHCEEFNDHMYPVKDLFISKTHKGSSKDSIQKAIQLLIEVENPENPLQDEEIVEELENMELYASRRTISKYRKELNIPNSKQRKKARLY